MARHAGTFHPSANASHNRARPLGTGDAYKYHNGPGRGEGMACTRADCDAGATKGPLGHNIDVSRWAYVSSWVRGEAGSFPAGRRLHASNSADHPDPPSLRPSATEPSQPRRGFMQCWARARMRARTVCASFATMRQRGSETGACRARGLGRSGRGRSLEFEA